MGQCVSRAPVLDFMLNCTALFWLQVCVSVEFHASLLLSLLLSYGIGGLISCDANPNPKECVVFNKTHSL